MTSTPGQLMNALRDGEVVPFVGAGVSMSVLDTSGKPVYPGWHALLSNAVIKLRQELKHHDANIVEGLLEKTNPDHYEAARYARDGMGPLWYSFLRDTFKPDEDRIDKSSLSLAKAVWKLSSQFIVTTNYDEVLRFALDKPNRLNPIDADATTELRSVLHHKVLDRPTVWHLHGQIHTPSKMILTPDGYRELYPDESENVQYKAALHALRHLLATRTLLFIGFSLEDAWFGAQVGWVEKIFDTSIGPHYMLVREQDRRETQRRLKDLRCIELIPFAQFGEPLVKKVEELADLKNLAPPISTAMGSESRLVSVPSPSLGETPVITPPPALGASPSSPSIDLCDVRKGFRAVYHYQRILFDRMAELSDALFKWDLEFERWDPVLFNRHARSSSEFFRKERYWAWDFLPAYRLYLAWQSSQGPAGEKLRVEAEFAADSGFRRIAAPEPDPRDFTPAEASVSELRLRLFRVRESRLSARDAAVQIKRLPASWDGATDTLSLEDGVCDYKLFRVNIDDILTKEGLNSHVIAPIHQWFAER